MEGPTFDADSKYDLWLFAESIRPITLEAMQVMAIREIESICSAGGGEEIRPITRLGEWRRGDPTFAEQKGRRRFQEHGENAVASCS